jgi:hypothetical protein
MFLPFFFFLRARDFKIGPQELLMLIEASEHNLMDNSIDQFYKISRMIFVKRETDLDKFDQAFGEYQNILENEIFKEIPEEWLKKNLERAFSEEEKAKVDKLGSFDDIWERFKELLEKQKERHQGGNTWIGTAGTSPFGAYGFNPEGYRVGQHESRHRRAIKVWDQRSFQDLSDQEELNTRNFKLVLKRLRNLVRKGVDEELDINKTIKKTTKNAGFLDIQMVPKKKNDLNLILLMDIGGSMDDHVEICSQLFSAAKYEFKHLEFYYFHNCLYDYVWKKNIRRHEERTKTVDLLRKFGSDYKVLVIGDAAMSPYEIAYAGGSVEYHNEEAGAVWLNRLFDHFKKTAWINPIPEEHWSYYESTTMIKQIFKDKMYPMTVEGLQNGIDFLKNKY